MNNSAPPTNDADLMQRVALRDRHAFSELYDRYSAILFSVGLRTLDDFKEAEDVIQEVFLQIWKKAATYNPALGKPLTWMVSLTRYRAIDRLRALQRHYKAVDAVTEETSSFGNAASDGLAHIFAEKAALVRNAIGSLTPEERAAIEMAFFGGMTHGEIAKRLEEPLGTVKARIRRGMLKMRDTLEGQL